MLRIKIACGVLILWLSVTPSFSATQSRDSKRLIIPDDLFLLRDVADVHLSPSGTKLVFVLSSIEKPSGREYSNIWVGSTDGGSLKQITEGEGNDSMPRWSPNRVFFQSRRTTVTVDRQRRDWQEPEAGSVAAQQFLYFKAQRNDGLVARWQRDWFCARRTCNYAASH